MVRNYFRIFGVVLLAFGAISAKAQTELIVRLDDGVTGPVRTALEEARAVAGTPAGLFEGVRGVRRPFEGTKSSSRWTENVYVLSTDNAVDAARQLSRWAAVPGVRYAQPNGTYALDLVDELDSEPYADSLGHLYVVRAVEAWDQTTGSPSVVIGLVDTGLYMEHPDFLGQVWVNPGEIPNNGIDDDGNGFIDDVNGYDFVDRSINMDSGDYYIRDNDPSEDGLQEHGTLTAGVMSAALNGVGTAGAAPGAKIVPVRAFGRDGVAEDDDLAAAIVYATDIEVDVINLSFGRTEDSPLLHEAIRYAYNQGTVVVASGGNAGGDAPHYPSDYPEAIGVVWLNQEGTDIEGFGGQYGPGIDLGAPGTGIFTTLAPHESDPRPLEEQLYGRRSGSSLSAPQVSGAAALLRSIDSTLNPESIRGILTSTARDIRDLGWDSRTGAGLLDVANALGLPYPTNVSLITPEQDGGAGGDQLVIVGSAIAPLFSTWSVDYATFNPDANEGEPIGSWLPIAGPVGTQVREDTLGVWQTGSIAEGLYLVRLVVELDNGQTLEDRRRVTVDRSPPVLDITFSGPAYFDGRQGVLFAVLTDDVTEGHLEITRNGGQMAFISSENREHQHGLFWPNGESEVGAVTARVTVENASGLSASSEETVVLDVLQLNSALFSETVLGMPSGYFMEKTTDFDFDGLREIVMNRLIDGSPTDSLMIYEWAGENNFIQDRLSMATLIPRDEGDTNDDGRRELLLQFGPNTYLLEAGARASACPDLENTEACYPSNAIFEDTTPSGSSRRTFWGLKLVDLDGDGVGEIIGHDLRIATPEGGAVDVRWRLFERDGSTFSPIADLDNPTGNSDDEEPVNIFNDSQGLFGDFDNDGNMEWLSGDYDGDFILYEHAGGNNFPAVWTYETDLYSAGSRLVQGDFDGDGVKEFWGMTTPKTAGGVEGAAYGLAQGFDNTGNNQFALQRTIAFQNLVTRDGTMAAADFDGDGTDELIVVHAPDVWIFSSANDWAPIFHSGAIAGSNGPTGYRSDRVVVHDFDGDLVPELVVSGADGYSRLFRYNFAQEGQAPPQWASAYAVDANNVHLSWNANADSVTVFAATPGETFNAITTTAASELSLSESSEMQYALRAWYGVSTSDLGLIRQVRPHAPAVVSSVAYPSGDYVRLTFTEKLDPQTAPEQFLLAGVQAAASLLFESDGSSALLRFDQLPAGNNQIEWSNVRDAEGTPVGQSSVSIEIPESGAEGTLLLLSWDIIDGSRARLVFNKSLNPSQAQETSNYRIDPTGSVQSVAFDAANPAEVELTISGRALGATGLRTTIVVTGVVGAEGATLAPEGNVATLGAFADDLADVYVFPNPFRSDQHAGRVIIAGLPRVATIEIYALGGEHVRSLEEFDGDGGTPWDLTDDRGEQVPSGIYLVRVDTDEQEPIMTKVAVIR